jgi:ankyrin repeat protein
LLRGMKFMYQPPTNIFLLLHPEIIAMPPPQFPLEILLLIAHQLLDDDDGLCLSALKSFRQVNRTLYDCLDPVFWREALRRGQTASRVLTSLIRGNDLARLAFFLELGIDIETRLPEFLAHAANRINKGPATPLIAAAELDNIPLVRLLFEKGAKTNFALHSARSDEMVQLLLDFNADPEEKGIGSLTPLHLYAQERGSLPAMKVVLRRGVEVDSVCAQGPWGWKNTPLHYAARYGNLDAVMLLLEFGADIRKTNRDGHTPLHLAAEAGEIQVVRLLVERWPENIKAKSSYGSYEQTPLHRAAEKGRTEVVKLLVERWPEGIRVKNSNGGTPLHLAAFAGEIEVVKFLVEGWPENIKEKNRSGMTPLHLAAAMGRTEAVKLLVEYWPEGVKALNDDSHTALRLAVYNGDAEMVRLLLDCWPCWTEDIGMEGLVGYTLLHSAAEYGYIEVLRLLMERWPEGIRVKDSNGDTPLHLVAPRRRRLEVVKSLAEGWPEGIMAKNAAGQTPGELSAYHRNIWDYRY